MIYAYLCCVFRFWNKVLFLLQQDPKVRANNSSGSSGEFLSELTESSINTFLANYTFDRFKNNQTVFNAEYFWSNLNLEVKHLY